MDLGRPPLWTDPKAFSDAVDEYFNDDDKAPHTWTGLAFHLGFESRQSLQDYKEKPDFAYPIKRALMRIEEIYERALFNRNAAGPIFALKNFNWKDRQEIAHEGLSQGFLNNDPMKDAPNDNRPTENIST